jgi:hypothetical protein
MLVGNASYFVNNKPIFLKLRIFTYFNTVFPCSRGCVCRIFGRGVTWPFVYYYNNFDLFIFIIANIPPFYDSYGENNAGWEDNDNDHAKIDHEITEEIYEDPLLTCHYLAAMGVTLYCIETNQYTTIYRDMYTAFSYITGGQFILMDKMKSLQKVCSIN